MTGAPTSGDGDGTGARSAFETTARDILDSALDALEESGDLMESDDLRSGRSARHVSSGRRFDGLRGLTPSQALRAIRRLSAILGPLSDAHELSEAAEAGLEELPAVIENRDNVIDYRRATDENFDESKIYDTGIPFINLLIGITLDRRYLSGTGDPTRPASGPGANPAGVPATGAPSAGGLGAFPGKIGDNRDHLHNLMRWAQRRAFESEGMTMEEGLRLFALLRELRRLVIAAAAALQALEEGAPAWRAAGLSEAQRANLAQEIDEARVALKVVLGAYDAAWAQDPGLVERIRNSVQNDIRPHLRGADDVWLSDRYPQFFMLPAQHFQVPFRDLPRFRGLLDDPVDWRSRMEIGQHSVAPDSSPGTAVAHAGFALPGGMGVWAVASVGMLLVSAALFGPLGLFSGGGMDGEPSPVISAIEGLEHIVVIDGPAYPVAACASRLNETTTGLHIQLNDDSGPPATAPEVGIRGADGTVTPLGTPESYLAGDGWGTWTHNLTVDSETAPDSIRAFLEGSEPTYRIGGAADRSDVPTPTTGSTNERKPCDPVPSIYDHDGAWVAQYPGTAGMFRFASAPPAADLVGYDDDAGTAAPAAAGPPHAVTVSDGSVWVATACFREVDSSTYGTRSKQILGVLEGTFDFTREVPVQRDGMLAVNMLVTGASFAGEAEASYRLDWGPARHDGGTGRTSIEFYVRVPLAVDGINDVPRWDIRMSYSSARERLNIGPSLAAALELPGRPKAC